MFLRQFIKLFNVNNRCLSKFSSANICNRNFITSNKRLLILSKFSPFNSSSEIILTRNFVTKTDQIKSEQEIVNDVKFDDVFNFTYKQIIDDLYSDQNNCKELNEVKQWLDRCIEYNLQNGKRNRAKILFQSYQCLMPNASKELLIQACILGWCIEFLQSFFLIHDDIMDGSITRRGKDCWYRVPNVGLIAINDGLMINSVIYFFLKKYFSSSLNYMNFVELFNDCTRYTTYGQCLDILSSNEILFNFNDDRYNSIVKYKTAYYSFCLPVRLSLYLANIADPMIHAKMDDILFDIGHYFQVQDDYLDMFGDPNVTGKIGTDIEDRKCSWLVVQALKLADQNQKILIEKNYGIKSKASVEIIQQLYKDLNLEKLFKNYEQTKYEEIMLKVGQFENDSLSKAIVNLLALIHHRKK